MKYTLNLNEDRRILSATYSKYAPTNAVIVDSIPDGNIADYRYVDGEFIYDPIPVVEEGTQPTTEERLDAIESALLEMMGVTLNG